MSDNFDFDDEDDDDEEEEGWLTSYSDMVTDLMAIFVLLFAFAMLNQGMAMSHNTLSILEGGVGVFYENSISAKNNNDEQSQQDQEFTKTQIDTLVIALQEHIDAAGLADRLSVSKTGDSIALLRISDSVLFDTGKADIKEEAKALLEDIAEIFMEYESLIKTIRLEGHTDSRPINTAQFPSNWQLSAGRADSVLQYLLEISELDPSLWYPSGLGEFHPVADNDTEEGMAKNRRVDFIIEAIPILD